MTLLLYCVNIKAKIHIITGSDKTSPKYFAKKFVFYAAENQNHFELFLRLKGTSLTWLSSHSWHSPWGFV